ncbi:hypothetical protein AB6A40_009070 [Gnathostoma spinigerum]|uniref:phosphoethanolamine N-methyltransferase n=1 Tax=Gnathostoma spinigerum TaxID=75299 RepID=A0ABD6EY02_9BILA
MIVIYLFSFSDGFKHALSDFGDVNFVKSLDCIDVIPVNDHFDIVILDELLPRKQLLDGMIELEKSLQKIMKILKKSGYLIIRQDLAGYSATKTVSKLSHLFELVRSDVDNIMFELLTMLQIDDSIQRHQNFLDVFWILKVKDSEKTQNGDEPVSFRDFLDKTQYTGTGIFSYEFVFGDNFISPGGSEENARVLSEFGNLKPGQQMLDIGVGIGGGARQAASEYGLLVRGIDLSSNMLSIALDRLMANKDGRVRYQIANALVYNFPEESFDYVYSRDCIHHNEDLQLVFNRIYKWLKPSGKVLMTMYGQGHGKWSEKFLSYVKQRKYYFKTIEDLNKIVKTAGFVDIRTEDRSEHLKELMLNERAKAINSKEEFIKRFSLEEYDDIVSSWTNKVDYIDDENLAWLFVIASKPDKR